MQARYYDPVIGRFYSNDPIGTLEHLDGTGETHGFNRYAYANNNPYTYTDPDGKSPVFNFHKGMRDGKDIISGQKTSENFKNEAKQVASVASYSPNAVGLIATVAEIAIEISSDEVPLSSGSSAILSETTAQLGNAIDNVHSTTPGGLKAQGIIYAVGQAVGLIVENLTENADNIVNQRTEEEIENK